MRELGLDNPAALALLPIFPLPNCVLLPGGLLPLQVFEPRYRELTRDCLAGHQLMGIARLRPGFENAYYGRPPVYEMCGVGKIICSEELSDGRYRIMLCDRLAEVIPKGGTELRDLVRGFETPGACADAVAAALVMDADARQALLEARDPMVRLQRTLGHVSHLLCELAPCHGPVN